MAVYFSHFLFEAPRASVLLPTAAALNTDRHTFTHTNICPSFPFEVILNYVVSKQLFFHFVCVEHHELIGLPCITALETGQNFCFLL